MKSIFTKSVLFEGKNPVEVAKFYLQSQPEVLKKLTDRDNLLLSKIASLDVEFDPAKFEVGKIFPWLVSLWKKNDPLLMSLVKSGPQSTEALKFKNAQQLFARPAFKKSLGVTDVNKFGSLADFMQKVSASFVETEEIPESPRFSATEINEDIRQGNIAKTSVSNDRYLVITPLKKKGACKYGNVHMSTDGGRWCTAKESDNAFDSYRDGTLYIFMDRKDGYKSKYQLHYKDNIMQFKDERNRDFDYEGFFDENIDIFDILFPEVARQMKSDEAMASSGISKIYKMLPKVYKNKFRENAAKYAQGLLAAMLQALAGDSEPIQQALETGLIDLDYDDLEFRKDGMSIEIGLDKIHSNLENWYWYYVNGFDSYSFDADEYEYMNRYFSDENKEEIIKLIRFFNPSFSEADFDKEGRLYEELTRNDTKKYFEKLVSNFAREYEASINSGHSKFIDETIERLPFVLTSNGIYIDYDKFTAYCLDKSIKGNTLERALELILENEGINDDSLYNYWETGNTDYEELKKVLTQDIDEARDKIEDDIEDLSTYNDNAKKLLEYVKELGFTKQSNGKYRKRTEFAYMEISEPNYHKGTVYMEYKDLKNNKETHRGDVKIDSLPEYVTMPMMFESVRRLVRKAISSL